MRTCEASEDQIQIAFVEWLRLNKIFHWHTPNGGRRHIHEAVKFKKMGVQSGIPDIFIPQANRYHHGLFIELKTSTGKLTANQKQWIEILIDEGYCAVVCYGLDQAIELVNRYKAQNFTKFHSVLNQIYNV